MKVLIFLNFIVDMIYLSESNRQPINFWYKNYSTFHTDVYTYSYHYGKDGRRYEHPVYNPDVSSSPKHERSYSFQNEKRNAEPPYPTRDEQFAEPSHSSRNTQFTEPPHPSRNAHFAEPSHSSRDAHFAEPSHSSRDAHFAQPSHSSRDSHYAESRHLSRNVETEFRGFNDEESDSIVYPSFQEDTTKRREEDKNTTGHKCIYNLCDDIDDYPGEYIKNLFSRTRVYDAFFNVTPKEPNLLNRFGQDEYNNLCRSSSSITYPRSAINKNKIKRYIPNYEEYRQGIRVETCEETDEPCQLSEMFPFGYETKCEQRFTTVVLLALDDDKNPIVDTFLSPSCCVCVYKTTKTKS